MKPLDVSIVPSRRPMGDLSSFSLRSLNLDFIISFRMRASSSLVLLSFAYLGGYDLSCLYLNGLFDILLVLTPLPWLNAMDFRGYGDTWFLLELGIFVAMRPVLRRAYSCRLGISSPIWITSEAFWLLWSENLYMLVPSYWRSSVDYCKFILAIGWPLGVWEAWMWEVRLL